MYKIQNYIITGVQFFEKGNVISSYTGLLWYTSVWRKILMTNQKSVKLVYTTRKVGTMVDVINGGKLVQFKKFGKIWVGGTVLVSSEPPVGKQFLYCIWVFVDSYICIRFDLSSINFRDISGSPNRGPKPLLRITLEGPKWYHWILLCDFLLVINCTRGRILHRFRDIAFDMCNIAIFGYPYCV